MLIFSTMTEGSVDDVNYLVLVRAQVMTRDDSSGGWVPLGGGGLSYVSVWKRALPPNDDETKHEYLICGKRIADQVVVLSCTIKKDFEYYKVMPTFHHWRTGDKKFGLAFQTAADARAFNKGVQAAVDDLLEGSLDTTHVHDADVGDDDVFMTIDLPVERGDSQSSSGSSGMGGGGGGGSGLEHHQHSPFTHSHANHHYLHRMHYVCRSSSSSQQQQRSPNANNNNNGGGGGGVVVVQEHQQQRDIEDVWVRNDEKKPPKEKKDRAVRDGDKIEILSEPYSYVKFARDRPSVHEYSYPMMDALKRDSRGDAAASGAPPPRKPLLTMKGVGGDVVVCSQPPLLPTKSKVKRDKKREKLKHLLLERSRCKHCHEMYSEEDNERGSCEYAPDCVRSCINAVTCLSCAQCMLYHCMSDAEGDFAHHPCSCDRTDSHCTRRWLGLTILSIFVPCLWCYLPLSTCHRCGVGYGLCGGRHEAS